MCQRRRSLSQEYSLGSNELLHASVVLVIHFNEKTTHNRLWKEYDFPEDESMILIFPKTNFSKNGC